MCKDMVPKKYVEFHFRKYHNNQENSKKVTSLKEIEFNPSPSASFTINEDSQEQEEECVMKTENMEDNYEMTTEDKIFSLLQELKDDLELVKNKVFDFKTEYAPDISIVDSSIFPLVSIADLETMEDKIANDPQFKIELVTSFFFKFTIMK